MYNIYKPEVTDWWEKMRRVDRSLSTLLIFSHQSNVVLLIYWRIVSSSAKRSTLLYYSDLVFQLTHYTQTVSNSLPWPAKCLIFSCSSIYRFTLYSLIGPFRWLTLWLLVTCIKLCDRDFWHLTKSCCFDIIIYEHFLSFWSSLNYCFFSDVQNLSLVFFWCCLNYYLFFYIQVTQTDIVFNSLQLKHDYTSIIHHLFSEIMSKDEWCELCIANN